MASKVQEIYQDSRRYLSGAHAQMERGDRMFDQQFDGLLDVPYEVRIFKSSTAANIIEGFRNQIRTDEPTVDYRPAGTSVAAKKNANLLKRWGYAQLRRERQVSILDPNLQCGFDLLLRGAACKKITVDVDNATSTPPRKGTKAYDEWETKALTRWPFVSRAIDPLSVFPSPGQRKPLDYMVERQVRYAGEVSALYPEWRNKDPKKLPYRPVEWLEYWDNEEYIVEADGQPVFNRENPYGFVPYVFEWSGMGRAHADADPRHLAIGILTSILGELEEEVRLKTAISVQTQMHVFPPILTVDDPQTVARQFGVGPGKVIQHMPGHPPEYMEYPAPNENMYRFLNVIHENIARVQSTALSGGRDPGVKFGVLQAQMIGQALTAIAPVLEAIDTIGTRTLNMMAMMMRTLDLTMVVEGTRERGEANATVRGKDVQHLNFDVTFEAVDPAENDRALLVGESLRRNGDISRRTLWQKYAKHVIEDPDEEDLNLMEEQLMEQLIASGALTNAVLSEDVQAQMMEQQQAAIDAAQQQLSAQQPRTQNRVQDTVPISAQRDAAQLEALSGPAANQDIPREVAEQGFASAMPSRNGLPRGGM